VIIGQRNEFMASALRSLPPQSTYVAVVGRAHVDGYSYFFLFRSFLLCSLSRLLLGIEALLTDPQATSKARYDLDEKAYRGVLLQTNPVRFLCCVPPPHHV